MISWIIQESLKDYQNFECARVLRPSVELQTAVNTITESSTRIRMSEIDWGIARTQEASSDLDAPLENSHFGLITSSQVEHSQEK